MIKKKSLTGENLEKKKIVQFITWHIKVKTFQRLHDPISIVMSRSLFLRMHKYVLKATYF